MQFDEEAFRADLLAGNWSEWLIDEVVRRLDPYLTPDEDAIVLTKDEAKRLIALAYYAENSTPISDEDADLVNRLRPTS